MSDKLPNKLPYQNVENTDCGMGCVTVFLLFCFLLTQLPSLAENLFGNEER